MKINKVVSIIAVVLAIVGVILFATIAAADGLTKEEPGQIPTMLTLAAIMIFIAALAMALFGIMGIISSGNIKKTLITLVGLLVVVVLGYGLSDVSADMIQTFANKKQPIFVEESTSKYVGTGLYVFYILAIIAIGTMIWGAIKKSLN